MELVAFACSVIFFAYQAFGLFVGDNYDHVSFAAAQRNLVVHDFVNDRVAQRGIENHFDFFAAYEPHFHNSATESAMSEYFENRGRLACFQIR